jgi:hypothetical protein
LAFAHVLFVVGSVLLATRRWQGAAGAAACSLAISLLVPVLAIPTHVGMYCLFLAEAMLGLWAVMLGIVEAKRGSGRVLGSERLRQDAAILLGLVLGYVLWGPRNEIIPGTSATEFSGGLQVTHWGILEFARVTTNKSFVPPTSEVQLSEWRIACALLLSVPGAWFAAWLWRRSPRQIVE